jgi:hypothetical protein
METKKEAKLDKQGKTPFNKANIILAVATGVAIVWYSPADIFGVLGGLVGAMIVITIIFKVFRWIPRITKRIENTNQIALMVALSIYLFIWASTHNFFGLL